MFLAALAVASCRGAVVTSDAARPVYLALGDSFTIGTGSRPDESFPALLAREWEREGRPVALANPAVNGYATDELIAEELPLARTLRPALVTVLIGANDIVRGHGEERYRAQLRRIYERLRADSGSSLALTREGARLDPAGPAYAIFALPQPDWSASPAAAAFGEPVRLRAVIERFNQIAKEEVERAGGTYLDIYPLMREQAVKRMVAPDGLHPSREAYAEWAAALAPLLRGGR